MKIANIIYENDLVNHTKVKYVNYIKNPVDYNSVDKSLPTLYVGWSFMKDCNPDNEIIQNANILHKKILTNDLYWEFSFAESKASHVKGIKLFADSAPQFYFNSKYKYVNLDPIFFQLVDIEDLMAVLPKKLDYMYIYKNEMVYVILDDNIWGINLKMFEFFEFNINDIKNRLWVRAEDSCDDEDGNIYKEYYKTFPNFNRLKRYIIVMLSKWVFRSIYKK